jgi:hypothetical protein
MLTYFVPKLLGRVLGGRDVCKKVLEPRRRREAVGNHKRAKVDELLRYDRRLLCGNHDTSSKMTLLSDDGEKRVGQARGCPLVG